MEWEKLAGFPSSFGCLHKTKLNPGMDLSVGVRGDARSVNRYNGLVVDEALRMWLCFKGFTAAQVIGHIKRRLSMPNFPDEKLN